MSSPDGPIDLPVFLFLRCSSRGPNLLQQMFFTRIWTFFFPYDTCGFSLYDPDCWLFPFHIYVYSDAVFRDPVSLLSLLLKSFLVLNFLPDFFNFPFQFPLPFLVISISSVRAKPAPLSLSCFQVRPTFHNHVNRVSSNSFTL